MQNLAVTPICAISNLENHKKFFSNIVDCPKCHHVKEVCTCKKNKHPIEK
jgi:hypothetical protein